MKKKSLKKWINPAQLSSLLFFAQCLDELLFHYTVDSFKAPALNTHTRVAEVRSLAQQLVSGRIAPGTLTPALEELEWSLKNDPVLTSKGSQVYTVFMDRLKKERANPSAFLSVARALFAELAQSYWDSLCNSIQEAVSIPRNNKQILSLASAFVAEVELVGYTKSYVYYENDNFFFNPYRDPEIRDAAQVRDFLLRFAKGAKKWRVVFRGSLELNKYTAQARLLNIGIGTEQPENVAKAFKEALEDISSSQYPLYVECEELNEKDSYAAKDKAARRLEGFVSVCMFHDHHLCPKIHNHVVVVDIADNKIASLKAAPHPMKCGLRRETLNLSENIRQTILIAVEDRFKLSALRTYYNALDYHRAALQSETPESQLVGLWAALEGFLPPPVEETSRVQHYVNALMPALTLTYPEKICRYISNSLYYGGPDIREHVKTAGHGASFFEKAVSLLVCEDLKTERRQLLSLMDEYPLLRYRCFCCYNDFGSAKHLRRSLAQHQRRVSWHIQRIYTTRNQIVHSARALPYLNTLVENLHLYIDTLLEAMVGLARKIGAKHMTIATAEKVLSVHAETFLQELENKVICKTDNFRHVVFGRANPLSPFA